MKTQTPLVSNPRGRKRRGFALVVTLAIIALITILTMGLLSLSRNSLKRVSNDKARSEAEARARLSLMLAIGELQKNTGGDTRVTAPANIVDENFPPVLGVWRSWEGTDHEANGRPIAPAYASKDQAQSAGGRFIDWLVSTAPTQSTPADAPSLVRATAAADTVPLLADGSLPKSDTRQIHVVPTKTDAGRTAWWVSGENQKARLAQPYKPRSDTAAGLAELGQSHGVTDPGAFGFAALGKDPEPFNPVSADPPKPGRRAVNRDTLALIDANNATKPDKKFHDLTTFAAGLLTNTATGDWRKDLSLLTERWDQIYAAYPGGRLPLFRYSPQVGDTSQVPKPVKPSASVKVSDANKAAAEAATPPQSTFYPWSRYSTIIGYIQPCTYHAASASWASLQSFATSYKGFTYDSGKVKSPFVWDKIAKSDPNQIFALEIYNHKHQQRLYPQIARFQLLVYATAIEDPSRLGQTPKRYQLRLNYVPLFTLWNPLNVTLEHRISGTVPGGPGTQKNFLGFGWRRSLPGVLAIANQTQFPNPDAVPFSQYRMLSAGNFQYLDRPGNGGPKDFELQRNIDKWGGGGGSVSLLMHGAAGCRKGC